MNGGLTMSKLSTWYQGEKAIQQQAGVADRMEEVGRRVVRDYMPDQHRASQAHPPFIVAGSVDRRGDAWAILIAERPASSTRPPRHRSNRGTASQAPFTMPPQSSGAFP
ncbi:hypothetical protein [Belnapia sp. F-4-1]|uniref:hypothetical protein n=1 Tax=Belnapia sp. F-4-1 TaxID=1545443 RepID=UPI0005BABBDF|nr:hypothetical protein [Belnapia sp. F-4-1]